MEIVSARHSILHRIRVPDLGLPVWIAGLIASGLIGLGSLDFRTTRSWGMSGMSEGAGRWAGWTFLLGLATGALLLLGAVLVAGWLPRWAALVFAVAAIPGFWAASIARSHLDRLRAEQDLERDYTLQIAGGLPLVATAGMVAGVIALLLALGTGWREARRSRRSRAPARD